MIPGGLSVRRPGPTRSRLADLTTTVRKTPDIKCPFCEVIVSDDILLRWHWTAAMECQERARLAGLI